MTFKTKYYAKQGQLSKDEFIRAISGITSAKSISGVIYTNIKCENNYITGIRETTRQPFNISIDGLYRAYNELDKFSTTALKPFVDRVQSPSMAILITIGAVVA